MTFQKPYVIIDHTKANLLYESKANISDGSIMEIVIWQLPSITKERAHGLKYRLNYSLPNGACLIRYDNKAGKGDHKHILTEEKPYIFKTLGQLLFDFYSDIIANGGLIE